MKKTIKDQVKTIKDAWTYCTRNNPNHVDVYILLTPVKDVIAYSEHVDDNIRKLSDQLMSGTWRRHGHPLPERGRSPSDPVAEKEGRRLPWGGCKQFLSRRKWSVVDKQKKKRKKRKKKWPTMEEFEFGY